MKRQILVCAFIGVTMTVFGQSSAVMAIKKQMAFQVEAWNQGDIDAFMKSYWQNDSLMFIGRSGITYGYTNTLNNYKKNYDSREKMGKLSFSNLQCKPISETCYFVVGKWMLQRTVGNAEGFFTLLFQKIKGRWVIVSDHSS